MAIHNISLFLLLLLLFLSESVSIIKIFPRRPKVPSPTTPERLLLLLQHAPSIYNRIQLLNYLFIVYKIIYCICYRYLYYNYYKTIFETIQVFVKRTNQIYYSVVTDYVYVFIRILYENILKIIIIYYFCL